MKAVIFAGGFGTRLAEETSVKPKPMVEIGGMPVLWHIMKIYSAQGVNEFIILCGYKGHVIKQYFADYFLSCSDVRFSLRENKMHVLDNNVEPWEVTLLDTGRDTAKGGRLLRAREHVGDETFCLTYGDNVSDVDLEALLAFHRQEGALVTLTGVQPPGRFGAFSMGKGQTKIESFKEKPTGDGAWVNGGFFLVEPEALDYVTREDVDWEAEPLENLAKDGRLAAYRHHGFWHPMDTLKDNQTLEEMWASGEAPWKIWR